MNQPIELLEWAASLIPARDGTSALPLPQSRGKHKNGVKHMKTPSTVDSAIAAPRTNTPKIGKNAATGKQGAKRGIAVEVTTPAESTKLAGEFGVKFSDATALWIVRGKTGQVRLADKIVIAICLLSKCEKYPTGESDKVRDTLKTYRKTFSKLTPEKKTEWLNKAQKVFSPARREYHATIKPLAQSVVGDKRFTLERFAVSCTKSGIVHVASRATHRPE